MGQSLNYLRKRGWTACVVEKRVPNKPITQDFAGFADILAFRAGSQGVLAVQTTTFDNRLARMNKICEEPRAEIWIAGGNLIEVHGWKRRKRYGRPKLELTIIEIGRKGAKRDGAQ